MPTYLDPTSETIPGDVRTQTSVQGNITNIPNSVISKQLERLQRFYTEYFAGTQVRIYVNDVRLEAVAIAWNASQSKTPIYGYASEQFDGVMKGNFLVNGEISIAFKDVATFHLIGEHIRERTIDYDGYVRTLQKIGALPSVQKLYLLGALSPASTPLVGASTNSAGDLTLSLNDSTIEDILGGSYEFETLASALEDSIWGLHPLAKGKAIKRADQLDYKDFIDRNGIPYTAIRDGLDFLITYGNVENPNAEHTIKSLNDIHFTGSSQSVDVASGYIIENYTFFARGMDEPKSGVRAFVYGAQSGDRLPDPSAFSPIIRSFSVPISTGIDPDTLSIDNSVILTDLSTFVESVVNDIKNKKRPKEMSPDYKIHAIIRIPYDWTESDSSYTSIADKNPAIRKQLLRKLGNQIVTDYIQVSFERPIDFEIIESGGVSNSIDINIEAL